MFQDSIRLLVHPNKETILDIIQSVTFKCKCQYKNVQF